jgi:hypothetical protein
MKYNKTMDPKVIENILLERNPAKRQEILDKLSLQEIFEVLAILGHKE